MSSIELPLRGEIWLAALGAARAGEPGKTRPVLVVTPEEVRHNRPDDLVAVVPISSSREASRFNPILRGGNGLDVDSVAVVRAIRSVAQRRMLECLGAVTKREQFSVDQALILSLGLARPG